MRATAPVELRTRRLAGLTLSVGDRGAVGGVTCNLLPEGATAEGLTRSGSRGARVSYLCSPGITAPDQLERATRSPGSKPLEGLGRLGMSYSASELAFWDSEADCYVEILWKWSPDEGLPFAKEVERELSQSLGEKLSSLSPP